MRYDDLLMGNRAAFTIQSPSDIPKVEEELQSAALEGPFVVAIIRSRGFTPTQAGEILGVSRQFVDRLISRGELKFTRLPGSTHRRIPPEEVDRFARERNRRRRGHAKAIKQLDAA